MEEIEKIDTNASLSYEAFDRQLGHFILMMELLVDGWEDSNAQEMDLDLGSLCIKASKLCYMADQDLALQHADATQGRKEVNEQLRCQMEELTTKKFTPFVFEVIKEYNEGKWLVENESPMYSFQVTTIFPRISDLLQMEGMTMKRVQELQEILLMGEGMLGENASLLLAQPADVQDATPAQEPTEPYSPEDVLGTELMLRFWNVLRLFAMLSYLLLHFRRVCNVTSRPLEADVLIRLTELKVQKYMSEGEDKRQLDLYLGRLRYENDGQSLSIDQWLRARRELKELVPPKFELAFLYYAEDTAKAGVELARLTFTPEEYEALVEALAKYQFITRRIYEINHPEVQTRTLPNEAFNLVVRGRAVDLEELKKSIAKMACLVQKKNQWFCVWSVLKHLNVLRDDCTFATFAHQMMRPEWFGLAENIVPFSADNLSDFSRYFNEYDYTEWREDMFLEKKSLYGMTKWSDKLCENFSTLCEKMLDAIWGYSFLV